MCNSKMALRMRRCSFMPLLSVNLNGLDKIDTFNTRFLPPDNVSFRSLRIHLLFLIFWNTIACLLVFYFAVSVLLGGLQFFWGYKIIAILWTFASESAAQILEEDAKEQMKKEEAKEKKKTK